jgi:peroxiredoxin
LRQLHYASLSALISLLGLAGCASHSVSAQSTQAKTGDRKSAPDFALKDADGRTVHLSDYHGKVVVLDFWATTCEPCKVEIPWLMEFEGAKKDRGFAVLGVSMDDGWDVIKPFLRELGVNYRVVLGDDKTADQYGGIDAIPTTFLIDREGRVYKVHVGLTSKKEFDDEIETLLTNNHPSGEKVSFAVGSGHTPGAVAPANN